jgi:hypothetical protein
MVLVLPPGCGNNATRPVFQFPSNFVTHFSIESITHSVFVKQDSLRSHPCKGVPTMALASLLHVPTDGPLGPLANEHL